MARKIGPRIKMNMSFVKQLNLPLHPQHLLIHSNIPTKKYPVKPKPPTSSKTAGQMKNKTNMNKNTTIDGKPATDISLKVSQNNVP